MNRLACLILFCIVRAICAESPKPIGTLVDAGGYRVHLYCTGSGSPTVVVAGGGFSFDWGLIQPQVASFTRICTYDPSGTAWSDPPPKPNPACSDRVLELHRVLQNAGVPAPYILVGFSIGGIIARLYAHDYPAQIAAMVIVDHAFSPTVQRHSPAPLNASDSPPILLSAPEITFGIEDDESFSKLPKTDQNLHTWAMSRDPIRPGGGMLNACASEIKAATKGESFPLHSMPLIIISTENDTPGYTELQSELLALSHTSEHLIARNSSHMVIIDDPAIVAAAIRRLFDRQSSADIR